MREITNQEVSHVAGGPASFSEGGLAVIAIGFAGGPATAVFGLLIGGAMLFVGMYEP